MVCNFFVCLRPVNQGTVRVSAELPLAIDLFLFLCCTLGHFQGRIHGGGDGGDRPPPREMEKITSSTIVVNVCADFVGVPVISALFSNQAPSTINIMKIAVCRMHYEPKMPRAVKRVLIYLLFNKPNSFGHHAARCCRLNSIED